MSQKRPTPAPRPRPQRKALTPRTAVNRSRVSNGADILPGVDQRSAIARRYRDLCSLIVADQGGQVRMSEARLQLVRRFAAASVLAEQMEARLVSGEQIDLQEHALLCSSLVRLAQRIGINRAMKDVSPTLADIMRETEVEETEA
jgi:hypothetical protein